MGRGPGLLSEIGFQVTAVSDGNEPEGQQAVKILRNDTEVSSTGTSSTLGDFNQDTLEPPVASSNGNIVLVSGTDTATPIIGGADPVGSGTFQKRHKVVPLTTLSEQGTKSGYVSTASAGSNGGDIQHSVATDSGTGKPLLAHRYVFTISTVASSAGSFVDNGISKTVGTAAGTLNDEDVVGWGTWEGQDVDAWLKLEVRGGVSAWYDSANTVLTGFNPSFSPAADILISTSQDLMMKATYAITNNVVNASFASGTSYPVVEIGAGVFSSQSHANLGAQINYVDQTIGTGKGDGYLYTGDLYDFASGGTVNEFIQPNYNWAATGAGATVTGDQDFKYATDRFFSDYEYSTNMKISGANNFAVGSSLPSAQGSVVYLTNGNKDIGWGLMGITYSIGAEVVSIPTGVADATFRYASSFTTGTFAVSTTRDNTTKCQDLPTVIEGDGSVNLNLCAGTESKFEVNASFAF